MTTMKCSTNRVISYQMKRKFDAITTLKTVRDQEVQALLIPILGGAFDIPNFIYVHSHFMEKYSEF